MRIRKISQSAATPGKIVNSPSDSTTETYSCNYTKDISAVVSPTEPTGNNKNKVWFKKSKNSFNAYEYKYYTRNSSETYQVINSNKISVTANNGTWSRVQITILSLKPNTSYTISSTITNTSSRNAAIIVSVGSTEKQSTSAATNIKLKVTFTTDSTGTATVTLFANWSSSSLSGTIIYNNLQLEEGTTDTQFEDYVKPEIYTKNDNNVYEEFTTKDYDVLWSNSNPSASFTGQTVTLNKSINEYSYYEVLFKDYYEENSCISTGKIKIMKTYLESCRYRNQVRELTSISDTSATFGDGLIYQNYGSNTATTNNNINIPLEIIGYK